MKLMKKVKTKMKLKIASNYYSRIKNKLYATTNYTEEMTSKILSDIITRIVISNILLFIMLIVIFGINLYMFIMWIISICLVNKLIIEKKIDDDECLLMKQIPDFISEVKSSFYEKRMILEAIYDASLSVPQEISIKAKEMHRILSSSRSKVEVEKYIATCKNSVLKMLISSFYIALEYGSNSSESKDSLMKNLNYILQETYIQIEKQELIKLKMKGILFATIMPVFFINFIESWSISNFESLSSFYNSSLGFIVKNVVVILTGIIIFLIIKIQTIGEEKVNFKINEGMSEKILSNKKVSKILKKIVPKEDKEAYKKAMALLEESYEKTNIRKFYLSKIICFIAGFIFPMILFISSLSYGKSNKLLVIISGLIISSLLSCLSFNLPNLILFLKKKMNMKISNDEVIMFNNIILLLINYERVSVEIILEYMEKFSLVNKNIIRKCLINYEKGNEYALKLIMKESENKELKKIIRNFILCVRNIKVKEAFEFLESEREFYIEKQKLLIRNDIKERANLCQLFAYIPYYSLVVLYFVTPMVAMGINQISEMINQITKM